MVARLRREAEELLAQARTQQAEVEARLASVEAARLELVEEARQDLQNRIGDLLAQLQQAERALRLAEEARAARARLMPAHGDSAHIQDDSVSAHGELVEPLTPDTIAAELQEQQAQLGRARREIGAAQWQPIEVKRTPWQERLHSGDRVYIRGIPRPVEVITPPDGDEQVEVLLGTMRARIPVYQLERPADSGLEPVRDAGTGAGGNVAGQPAGESPVASGPGSPGADSPGVRFRHNRDAGVYYRRPSPRQVKTDLDLRGQRVDAALDQVENLLNQAALSGVPEIRIIHGRGTGALRRAVREYLQGHPLIATAGPSTDAGGDGVTVVELK